MAVEKALEGVEEGQTPFGACIVRGGDVVTCEHNTVWAQTDITAHAEVTAIRRACLGLGTIDLSGCVIYPPANPAPCASAPSTGRASTASCTGRRSRMRTRPGSTSYGYPTADEAPGTQPGEGGIRRASVGVPGGVPAVERAAGPAQLLGHEARRGASRTAARPESRELVRGAAVIERHGRALRARQEAFPMAVRLFPLCFAHDVELAAVASRGRRRTVGPFSPGSGRSGLRNSVEWSRRFAGSLRFRGHGRPVRPRDARHPEPPGEQRARSRF